MSLQRSHTRFGLYSVKGAPPDSDENDSNETGPLLVAPDNDSSNKLRKRSWESQDDGPPLKIHRQSRDGHQKEARSGLKKSHIPQAIQSKVSAAGNIRIKHSSPWEILTKRFRLSLEDSVMIASREDGRLVAVREFFGPDADRKINMLQRIRQENVSNFLEFLDCFSFEGIRYAVFEHEINKEEKLPVTLCQYARTLLDPTDQQLATILGQVSPPWGIGYILIREADFEGSQIPRFDGIRAWCPNVPEHSYRY